MKYLTKKYENFEDLYADFSTIESHLIYICTDKEHLQNCIKDLKEEAKKILEA